MRSKCFFTTLKFFNEAVKVLLLSFVFYRWENLNTFSRIMVLLAFGLGLNLKEAALFQYSSPIPNLASCPALATSLLKLAVELQHAYSCHFMLTKAGFSIYCSGLDLKPIYVFTSNFTDALLNSQN